MKVMVTGGLGFIGSNFINYWLKKYPEDMILNVDKVTYAADFENIEITGVSKNYVFMKEDICIEDNMISLTRDCDVIVNFAAESHVDNSISNAKQFLRSNYFGVYSLLEAARKNDVRIHQVSTDEVFGPLTLDSKVRFDENTSYNPQNPYSATKAAADHLVRSYVNTYGIEATISNCSNNFGPNQHREKLIPKSILRALEGKKIPIYGTGKNVRDWIYVEDHCAAIDKILKRGKIGETYLVGAENEMSNVEIVSKFIGRIGLTEDLIEFVSDRPGHDLRYSINPAKIVNQLDWKPSFSLNEAIDITLNYYTRKFRNSQAQ